ncbi:MAG: tRNA (adenosine(37)-N6)-threonylcarbamoyltransferase complex transferase subunit TsaD [Desulfobulbaceae bacterium]|nr:tRNA (adenosine(37)-N6)-threonylcarbamoyltransferase complex transferase subunit TsaD [Desulfobulbaceae bacterium]HIJ90051.1 tRNA (adenosine(37)-N6)-threonylcarbamoyltransferase complex transferase subunit TsaD [Deltaproteobacteria bacterium]
MLILGIESSCDETAAAVLRDGNTLLSNVINSQIAVHSPYGGVVPELASRKHLENIYPVVETALSQAGVTLDDIDGLAVTQGPGLVGSLLIGLSFAKAISAVKGIPYVGVDHIVGHLLSPFLEKEQPEFPYIALVASGGHSSIFLVQDHTTIQPLGRTRDDAAGEAFDKVGKILDLEYPGGPVISRLAEQGNPAAIPFPRAWLTPDSLDFSFSGLKTAVANYVHQRRQKNESFNIPDICASFQEAVVEVLCKKVLKAAKMHGISTIALAGGVAANIRLRTSLQNLGAEQGVKIFMPSLELCTDNAAMIALAGFYQFSEKATTSFDTDAYSRSPFLHPGAVFGGSPPVPPPPSRMEP